jgi:TRAP-type transport system periplasmic protein
MSRMKWAALAAVAVAISGFSHEASAETWRMAHKMPADSVEGVIFQAGADRIAEKTDGKITVQVFPNEQLGKDDAILEQLQMGTVHIYPEGSSYLQKWVPDMQFVSAPFLFDDREHWSRFMSSDLVHGWHERIEQEAGITVIGDSTAMVRGPYRVMVVKKPVESLDDIDGLRLRLHPDELAAAAWRHLGAEVRTLGWTEVYESLGRGIVEAVNSPVALVEPMRFYEVAPYVVRHDEYPQGLAFMANAQAWYGLDEKTRQQILEAYDEVAAESEAGTLNAANESIERMKAEGVTFSEIDSSAFVDRMMELYTEMDSRGELPEGFLQAVADTRQGD